MSAQLCFACPDPATATASAVVDGQACEAPACEVHRAPEHWARRTRELFARVARRVGELSKDAVGDLAQEIIEEALD